MVNKEETESKDKIKATCDWFHYIELISLLFLMHSFLDYKKMHNCDTYFLEDIFFGEYWH